MTFSENISGKLASKPCSMRKGMTSLSFRFAAGVLTWERNPS